MVTIDADGKRRLFEIREGFNLPLLSRMFDEDLRRWWPDSKLSVVSPVVTPPDVPPIAMPPATQYMPWIQQLSICCIPPVPPTGPALDPQPKPQKDAAPDTRHAESDNTPKIIPGRPDNKIFEAHPAPWESQKEP